MVWNITSDSLTRYPWVYYQLGGDNRQLAIYHGQQVNYTMCGATGAAGVHVPWCLPELRQRKRGERDITSRWSL